MGRGLVFQAIWFWFFYISSALTKVGCLFVTQISATAFIRVAALNRSFTVTALFLGKKGKNERFIFSLDFIGPFVSNR